MATWKQFKLCGLLENTSDNSLQDRIGLLPDEILVSILAYLPMRQAVATSVLSKRWQNLWTRIPELTFDAYNMCIQELSYVQQRLKTFEFVRWVDRILSRFAGGSLKISSFSVFYELTEAMVSHIDHWVLFALEHNVQRLSLHLCKGSSIGFWSFPPHPGSGKKLHDLRHLHLGGCKIVPFFGGFKNLKLVYLTNVVVPDEAFEDFLSNCSLLAELFVCSAKGLTNVRFPVSLVWLRSLQVYFCGNLQKMEVNPANLVSFSYIGAVISFSFSNISRLRFLRLCWINNVLVQLMSKNLLLNTLLLDFDLFLETMDMDYKLLPTLNNLEILILSVDSLRSGFVGLADLLRATPSLKKFGLHLKCADSPTLELDEVVTEKFCHKNIREIELSGFSSQKEHIDLAFFLIESAVALEKITIVPYFKRWHLGKWHCEKPDPEQVVGVRKCANQIASKLPPAAKLEILDS